MEKFKDINSSNKEQNIDEINASKNKIKSTLINILINGFYINESNSKKLNTLNDVANYMKALIKDDIITEDNYMKMCIESGAIKLGQYLVYKEIISKEELNIILNEQKIYKQYENKNIGEILIEKKIINFKDLVTALEEFGVIRLGEYLILKGIINEYQLKIFLRTQQVKNIPLGKILIDYGILTQEKLNIILTELGTKLNQYDFLTEEDEELDYYRIKE